MSETHARTLHERAQALADNADARDIENENLERFREATASEGPKTPYWGCVWLSDRECALLAAEADRRELPGVQDVFNWELRELVKRICEVKDASE